MDPKIRVKVSLSNRNNLHFYDFTLTDKDLFSLLIKASSPKCSPSPKVRTSNSPIFYSDICNFKHSTYPDSIIQNSSPSSPSLMINSPFSY